LLGDFSNKRMLRETEEQHLGIAAECLRGTKCIPSKMGEPRRMHDPHDCMHARTLQPLKTFPSLRLSDATLIDHTFIVFDLGKSAACFEEQEQKT